MVWVRGEQRDPDKPEEGYYALKLVKGGPEVAACILRVPSEAVEHSLYEWGARADDEPLGISHLDPQLANGVQQVWLFGRRISQQEHDFMLARARHAKLHDPQSPWANPRKPLDLKSIPPIGGG